MLQITKHKTRTQLVYAQFPMLVSTPEKAFKLLESKSDDIKRGA